MSLHCLMECLPDLFCLSQLAFNYHMNTHTDTHTRTHAHVVCISTSCHKHPYPFPTGFTETLPLPAPSLLFPRSPSHLKFSFRLCSFCEPSMSTLAFRDSSSSHLLQHFNTSLFTFTSHVWVFPLQVPFYFLQVRDCSLDGLCTSHST